MICSSENRFCFIRPPRPRPDSRLQVEETTGVIIEQEMAPFASTSPDDCKRLHLGSAFGHAG